MARLNHQSNENPNFSGVAYNSSSSSGESSNGSSDPSTESEVAANVVAKPKPTIEDGANYVRQVKYALFEDYKEKYDRFLYILRAYRVQLISIPVVMVLIKELLKQHPYLILGFNLFLPGGYEITLEADEEEDASSSFETNVPDFPDAERFMNKLREREESVYESVLEVFDMYSQDCKCVAQVTQEITSLLIDHKDLLQEFSLFLPEILASHVIPCTVVDCPIHGEP